LTREAPELPEAARPAWPAWNAPVAPPASFVLILASAVPLLPAVLLVGFSETVSGLALLALLLVQDGALVAAALVFAHLRVAPCPWHFGIRATRLWPTLGWAVLGFAVMLGFELGFAVIAIHAAFNTVAMPAIEPLPAVVVGSLVLAACLAVPRVVGRYPSPLPA
jgi:hypothetical protein